MRLLAEDIAYISSDGLLLLALLLLLARCRSVRSLLRLLAWCVASPGGWEKWLPRALSTLLLLLRHSFSRRCTAVMNCKNADIFTQFLRIPSVEFLVMM